MTRSAAALQERPSRKLKLAKDLSLPIDAATQTFAFIARKGAGKTYAAGKLVELLLEAHVQVAVLDTVGNWYGLRLSADGKSAGFDVPVLGGLRGDIHLDAAGGALIADIVVETGRSIVVDMSQFSLADRKRFATAFAERLWQKKKAERHPAPLHLVIEESQLIVPQDVRGDTAKMVGIYEEIIRLGRNYGIGVSMITQRPQSVNKEVLNQTECLLVGQVNGAQEREALKKWVTHQGMDVDLVDELPGLKVGTFYVWSPQWLQLLQLVEILPKQTFDASATPKVGDKRVRRDLKPLDLTELQERLQATIDKAKAEDPRELRKQVADLKHQLAKKDAVLADVDARAKRIDTKLQHVKPPKVVEKPVVTEKVAARFDQAIQRLEKTSTLHRETADVLATAARELRTDLVKAVAASKAPMPTQAAIASPPRTPAPRPPATPRPASSAPAASGSAAEEIGTSGAYRMLVALAAQHPAPCTASKLALLTGIARKGGTFRTYLGKLKTLGWVEGGNDALRITEAGLAAVGDYEPLPRGQALIEFWQRELGNSGARNIFDALVAVYPQTMSREHLAAQVNMAVEGGTFRTYLGKLRTMELIERKALKASDVLFE